MDKIGYYNGEIGRLEDMTIPMNDRCVYFGDGVYDACMAANHIIYAFEAHIDRFYNSFSKLDIPFSKTKDELKNILQTVVDKADTSVSLMVYWQTTRGTGLRSHVFPTGDVPANLLITVFPAPFKNIDFKYKLATVEDTRHLHCDIKTLNLLPNVIASQRAMERGCQEAVFHRGQTVTECAHSNLSIIKSGVFRTAPLNNQILPGTSRRHLIEIANRLGIPVEERAFTLDEMFDADEIIVTSSSAFCNAAAEIDGIKVGGASHEILTALQKVAVEDFEEYTKLKFSNYTM